MKHPPYDPVTYKLLEEESEEDRLVRLLRRIDWRDLKYFTAGYPTNVQDIYYQHGYLLSDILIIIGQSVLCE